ncbi:hypothetical protein BC938DRAFT_483758 [Jimgerdemannia flammicorona]|uniref:Uncharacterized protein n=1 Tax=Jimgerdemannia flammicorona TaxID=994334 RepID=A0A433QBA7_9FUNG|nr:hypothetical protein BC938DRAFT_483758 [Jimgerdemannia flammicorona]
MWGERPDLGAHNAHTAAGRDMAAGTKRYRDMVGWPRILPVCVTFSLAKADLSIRTSRTTDGLLPLAVGQLNLYVAGDIAQTIQNFVDMHSGQLTFTVPNIASRTNYQIGFLASSNAQRSGAFTILPAPSSSSSVSSSSASASSSSLSSSISSSSLSSSTSSSSSFSSTKASTTSSISTAMTSSTTSSATLSPSMIAPAESDSPNYTGPIVGAVIGSILSLAFVGGLITYIKRRGGLQRYNNSRQNDNFNNSGFAPVPTPLEKKQPYPPPKNDAHPAYQFEDEANFSVGVPHSPPTQSGAAPRSPQRHYGGYSNNTAAYSNNSAAAGGANPYPARPPPSHPTFSAKHEADAYPAGALAFGGSSEKCEYDERNLGTGGYGDAMEHRLSKPHAY